MAISIFGVKGIPLVKEGDDIAAHITEALRRQGERLRDKDVVVITQKIVSKAEGRRVRLDDIEPSRFAHHIAESMEKDPRVAEAVLGETARIIRMKGRALIVETHHGHVCANAGVDYSNVEDGYITLLPVDPDGSARRIRDALGRLTGVKPAVVITDTWGRAWRMGQVDFAIGVAGMSPFRDYRGEQDMMGHTLAVTNIAVADELASAAELVKGKADGVPVVIVRGYDYPEGDGAASELVRPLEEDLFR
ncbi:coenzyme F420-0:L-glutamate ligase [Candidatus Bathyarchaeota archaeon]|nr:coenzyme F420-0:L-glutamate ligase [Candidatus Bathyarchaeota archaeon]